jgi:hypothetical protein
VCPSTAWSRSGIASVSTTKVAIMRVMPVAVLSLPRRS